MTSLPDNKSEKTGGGDRRYVTAIEAIYEAAAEPERWPAALSAIAQVFDAAGAVLLHNRDDGSLTAIVSPGLEAVVADYDRGWWRHDIRVQRGFERSLLNEVAVFTDRHVVSPEEHKAHPFYAEFLAKHGLGYFIGGSVSPHPKVFAALSVQGSLAKGPFTDDDIARLTGLSRHVEKALRLSIRLMEGEVAGLALSDALSRMRAGVIVADEGGNVVFCNAAAKGMLGDGLTIANGRIGAELPEDAAELGEALAAAAVADAGEAGFKPVLIRGHQRKRPLVAYVLPVRHPKERGDVAFLLGGRAMVLLLDQDPGAPPDPSLVRDLLNITLGEARVASLVGSGKTTREAAEALGITEETTRTVLKRIYTKAGISRQSELTALLARLMLASD
jgi:DNA-binding CsgD family transcriptional regulator/PAS domain-containing protein